MPCHHSTHAFFLLNPVPSLCGYEEQPVLTTAFLNCISYSLIYRRQVGHLWRAHFQRRSRPNPDLGFPLGLEKTCCSGQGSPSLAG